MAENNQKHYISTQKRTFIYLKNLFEILVESAKSEQNGNIQEVTWFFCC